MGAHIQKSSAVLKQVPEGHAFEDLTHQNDPPESENTHQLVREIVPEAVEAPVSAMSQSQKHIKTFCRLSGLLQIHPLCRTAEL